MPVYLDATDVTKNIDLLLDPEVKVVTKEYVDAEALRSTRNSMVVAAICIGLANFVFRNWLLTIMEIGCLGLGVNAQFEYMKAQKVSGYDLDEVYQKIALKIEDLALSEIPEEKRALLRKVEVIKNRYFKNDIEINFPAWSKACKSLCRVEKQLNREGVRLSNQDYVEIISNYLKDNQHKDLILHLFFAVQNELFETVKIRQIMVDYYSDKNEVGTSFSIDHQGADLSQLPQFLEDKKDFELLLELIFKIAKGMEVANLALLEKILKEYHKEKQIGMESNSTALATV
ncbi:MAG: hypothetical protein K940chlam8_00670 [Chlamydiae bacterium]|nr:hypothetical protein [Chlamydiota bacterium]